MKPSPATLQAIERCGNCSGKMEIGLAVGIGFALVWNRGSRPTPSTMGQSWPHMPSVTHRATMGRTPTWSRSVHLLRNYLKSRYANQNLHNRIWLLLASACLTGLLAHQERQDLIQEIKNRQKDGGWTLKNLMSASSVAAASKRRLAPETDLPDSYATGLAVYTLRKAGVPRGDPNLQGGVSWLKKNQLPQGAWPALSINKKRGEDDFAYWFMSDAGTAWAVMALIAAE